MALNSLDCAIKWTINVKQVVIEMTTRLHYVVHIFIIFNIYDIYSLFL